MNFKNNFTQIILIFLFGLVLCMPLVIHPNWLPMPLIDQTTDLLITHLPISQQVNFVISHFQQIPLWNSFQFSGQPLAADPLSGYFYPPNWILFLFPVPITFNFLFYLHIVWSGIGVYFFLKKKDLHNLSALFAALCWMGTPKLIGYIAGGQVSTIFALSWLPWLLISCDWLIQDLSLRKTLITSCLSAIVFYADIRWGFYIVLFAAIYVITRSSSYKNQWKNLILPLVSWGGSLLIFTAVISMPLIEFMQYSRRANLSIEELNFMSISPESLIGIFAPQVGIYYEKIIYFGIITLILSLISIKKQHWFWIITIVMSSFYSLGANTFFYPAIVKAFPFLTWLRVPSRAWFFVVFSLAILSGYGLERLIKQEYSKKFKKAFLQSAIFFSLLAVSLSIGIKYMVGFVPIGMVIMVISVVVSFVVLSRIVFKRKSGNDQFLLIIILLFGELVYINSTILKAVPVPPKTELVKWLESQPGLFRVYSPSYSFPMPNYLQQANGVDPMHLETYSGFMREASGISTGKYSVSLPDIYIDSQTPNSIKVLSQYPDSKLLGLLNVRYLAANYELKSKNLKKINQFDNTYLYETLDVKDRAWFEGGTAEILNWSPNNISIKTNGKGGRLILSEIDYPGWVAKVDGNSIPIEPYQGLLRSISISPGNHVVQFVFLPVRFFVGGIISLAGWLGLILFVKNNIIKHLKREKE